MMMMMMMIIIIKFNGYFLTAPVPIIKTVQTHKTQKQYNYTKTKH